jgi:hypothetical protein
MVRRNIDQTILEFTSTAKTKESIDTTVSRILNDPFKEIILNPRYESINTIPESIDRSFHFPNIVEVVVLNIENPRTSAPPNILITWNTKIIANENRIEP